MNDIHLIINMHLTLIKKQLSQLKLIVENTKLTNMLTFSHFFRTMQN